MQNNPNGIFEIQRGGELVVVRFKGVFNLEGARSLTHSMQLFWYGCGEPKRRPILGDYRAWEGATPETFVEAAVTLRWIQAHGLAAEARVFSSNFMPRVLDQQEGMKAAVSPLPSSNFNTVDEACDWLESLGFDCGDYREQATKVSV